MYLDATTDSTDITIGTKAEDMYRFLCETRNLIYDLKLKEKMFADAYIKELRRASIPYFFDTSFLELTRDEKKGKSIGRQLLGFMLGDSFVTQHKVKFVDVIGYNSYIFSRSHGYYVRFDCDGITYQFFIPSPRNIEIKDPESLIPICFTAHYCKGIKESCNTWNFIPGSGDNPYDWKAVCDSMKTFIEKQNKHE